MVVFNILIKLSYPIQTYPILSLAVVASSLSTSRATSDALADFFEATVFVFGGTLQHVQLQPTQMVFLYNQ